MIALALLATAPLTCGAVPRPGVAMLGENGIWRGAAVNACRRAGKRLGRSGIRFRGYRSRAALAAAMQDDIAFLSALERRAVSAPGVVVGSWVAKSTQLLVARRPLPAGGRPILCFIIGSAAQDALEQWIGATRRDAIPLGFQEPDEMADGLASGKCAAMAIDAADRHAGDIAVATLSTLPIDAVASVRNAARIAAVLR